ncbi:methyl-accepting chemotaxis protein [Hahella sp. CR1]|uniref:methyl-accepting chemotaxis protein n=1 Tax=Hahella sp. CR1 TaxID=2992807 RepID=UPI002441E336|nr:methyl-accepting chemotaxis protein [Hahella sp. CR1]MDG9666103.1 methyl-accepting chemotaxis protein [Hahella sp. CR1]
MFKKLKVWQQLLIFALVFSLPLAFLLGKSVVDAQRLLNEEQLGQQGLEIIRLVIPVQKLTAEHRGTTALLKNGDSSVTGALQVNEGKLDAAWQALLDMARQHDQALNSLQELQSLHSDWTRLKGGYGGLSGSDSFARHTDIILGVDDYFKHVAEYSTLAVNHDVDIRFLTTINTVNLPVLVENMGKLRGGFAGQLARYVETGDTDLTTLAQAVGLGNAVMQRLSDVEHNIGLIAERYTELPPLLEKALGSSRSVVTKARELTGAIDRNEIIPRDSGKQFFADATAALTHSFALWDSATNALAKAIEADIASAVLARNLTVIVGVLIIVALLALGYFIVRSITGSLGGEPAELEAIAQNIAAGRLEQKLEDRFGVYGQLRIMRDQLREQKVKDEEQLVRMTRLRQAMETASVGLMVANEEFKITYMNPTVKHVLKNAESEIRKRLPQFNADNLLGECIDVFHKNPEHQRRLLSQLKKPHDARLQLGNAFFDLTAGAIRDQDESILGFVVEWNDISSQIAIEREVQEIVDKAKAGDLKKRVGLEGKEGFVRTLAEGLNELSDVIDQVLVDIDAVMQRLADGDLRGRMREDYHGQYASLSEAVNGSMVRLEEIISQLNQSSESVRASNQEISTGNNQLSERTEKQSSSLEETASSIEELSSNVRNTADNARQADQLANFARSAAAKGGEVTQRTVSSMGEINEASRKIAEIIGVIDDIAFQTNLLALNASVEAARAGDQGRGFAVVATEVRNLAQRSATSAREIKDLIEDSVKKVQTGSQLVDESGKNLDEIILHVKKVSDLISDIASATEEQSSGIEQVNRAVMELDEITQQNAALAEETASSAESSLESVQQMVQLMSFFKMDGAADEPVTTKSKPGKAQAQQTKKTAKAATRPQADNTQKDEDWEVF